MLLERELVKEGALLDLPLTHHLLHSVSITGVNQQNSTTAISDFFNRIDPERTMRAFQKESGPAVTGRRHGAGLPRSLASCAERPMVDFKRAGI
jgi:hypothetical protein